MTMTSIVFSFEAQQRDCLVSEQFLDRAHGCNAITLFENRSVGRSTSRITIAEGLTIGLGIAQGAQMNVSNAGTCERVGQASLRHAWLARQGCQPNIDEHRDGLSSQVVDQLLDTASLVTDADQLVRGHANIVTRLPRRRR